MGLLTGHYEEHVVSSHKVNVREATV